MRPPSSRHSARERGGDDRTMTPMIDVVFLLLIFFVCASLGREPEALLPTTLAGGVIEAADPDEPPPPLGEVWVALSRRGDETLATVNERRQSLDELQRTLTGLANVAPEIPVILDAADDVPVGDVIRVFDAARAAGFETIRFATEPANPAGTARREPTAVLGAL